MTPLDAAHAAMEAAPDDDRARLAYFEAFAAAELTLLLADDSPMDNLRPKLFDTEDGCLALVFDGEDRLAAFAGSAAHYAAMPGRELARSLSGQGIALGLNFPEGPAAFLIPAQAIDWLARSLAAGPEPVTGRPEALSPPHLPQPLLAALDRRLARAGGLARRAFLADARWPDGQTRHLIALLDAVSGAENALTQAIGEAVALSGAEAGALDVMFLRNADPLASRLARVALAIDLPQPAPRPSPGSDPSRPPKLR